MVGGGGADLSAAFERRRIRERQVRERFAQRPQVARGGIAFQRDRIIGRDHIEGGSQHVRFSSLDIDRWRQIAVEHQDRAQIGNAGERRQKGDLAGPGLKREGQRGQARRGQRRRHYHDLRPIHLSARRIKKRPAAIVFA